MSCLCRGSSAGGPFLALTRRMVSLHSLYKRCSTRRHDSGPRRRIGALLTALFLSACTTSPSNPNPDPGIPDPTVPPVLSADDDYIFDLQQFHNFSVEVKPEHWQWLQDNARSEEYVPAIVSFDNKTYPNAAIRYKGGYGSLTSCFNEEGERICPKLSLKIKFNHYDKSGRFFGLRKISFNSSVRDPTLMHEVLGYSLFRAMGVPAPRASHATIHVNGEDLGIFVMVEAIDKEFVQRRWPDDEGNLYKEIWPEHADPRHYVEALRTNEDTPNVARMVDFYQTLLTTTQEAFRDNITPYVDMDAITRYFAVDRAISNSDGISGIYCYGLGSTECENRNFYWYEHPSGRFDLIPWDLDYTFGGINDDLGVSYHGPDATECAPVPACIVWEKEDCDPEIEDVFLLPAQCDELYGFLHRETWPAYLDALQELADGPLAQLPELHFFLLDKIRSTVDQDAFGPGLVVFESKNSWLKEVLEEQRIAIQNLLATNPTIP